MMFGQLFSRLFRSPDYAVADQADHEADRMDRITKQLEAYASERNPLEALLRNVNRHRNNRG